MELDRAKAAWRDVADEATPHARSRLGCGIALAWVATIAACCAVLVAPCTAGLLVVAPFGAFIGLAVGAILGIPAVLRGSKRARAWLYESATQRAAALPAPQGAGGGTSSTVAVPAGRSDDDGPPG